MIVFRIWVLSHGWARAQISYARENQVARRVSRFARCDDGNTSLKISAAKFQRLSDSMWRPPGYFPRQKPRRTARYSHAFQSAEKNNKVLRRRGAPGRQI